MIVFIFLREGAHCVVGLDVGGQWFPITGSLSGQMVRPAPLYVRCRLKLAIHSQDSKYIQHFYSNLFCINGKIMVKKYIIHFNAKKCLLKRVKYKFNKA